MIICPWMVFESDQPHKETPGEDWHLIIQIRIKTSATYFIRSKHPQTSCPDPVRLLLTKLGEQKKSIWRNGDTVFRH